MRFAIGIVFNTQRGTYANIKVFAGPGYVLNQQGSNPENVVPGYIGSISIANTGSEVNARQIADVVTTYIAANPSLTFDSDLRPLEALVRKVMDFRAPYALVSTQPSPEVQAEIDAAFAMMEMQDVEIEENVDLNDLNNLVTALTSRHQRS